MVHVTTLKYLYNYNVYIICDRSVCGNLYPKSVYNCHDMLNLCYNKPIVNELRKYIWCDMCAWVWKII
jgi:hypothetical protein